MAKTGHIFPDICFPVFLSSKPVHYDAAARMRRLLRGVRANAEPVSWRMRVWRSVIKNSRALWQAVVLHNVIIIIITQITLSILFTMNIPVSQKIGHAILAHNPCPSPTLNTSLHYLAKLQCSKIDVISALINTSCCRLSVVSYKWDYCFFSRHLKRLGYIHCNITVSLLVVIFSISCVYANILFIICCLNSESAVTSEIIVTSLNFQVCGR